MSPSCRATVDGKEYACSLGRSDARIDKREGDGATPAGEFPLRKVLYRPDRVGRAELVTALPVEPIAPDDGWSDDPAASQYNRPVKLPYAPSHERLWREDGLYDIVVVVGYNDDPPIPGEGSAIFLHVRRPDGGPTAGCVAFSREDLLAVLRRAGPQTRLRVAADGSVSFVRMSP